VQDLARAENPATVDVFEIFEDYDKQPGKSINDLLFAGNEFYLNSAAGF